MRILLTHHAPLRESPSGWLVWQWAQAFEVAGHQVRILIADEVHRMGEPLEVDRVVCGDLPNADLRFGLPRFAHEDENRGWPTFAELSDAQLGAYRDCLRRRLDNQILHFDPNIIHCQHLWVFGQLALESGVPYVLTAWEAEAVECQRDARYRPLAEQAAENASRILIARPQSRSTIEAQFELPPDRTLDMPPAWNLDGPQVEQAALELVGNELQALYQTALTERFG
jgi:hypothetical protein